MKLRPLDSPLDLYSPYNSGWLYGLAVGSSVVLVYIMLPLLAITLELIC